jgi:hypothetical protein
VQEALAAIEQDAVVLAGLGTSLAVLTSPTPTTCLLGFTPYLSNRHAERQATGCPGRAPLATPGPGGPCHPPIFMPGGCPIVVIF